MAAQLEHPLGYSCVGSAALRSAANFASAQESSPVPCLVQPRGIQGCSQALRPQGQEDAPCRTFCPVSPAGMGSQEKFTLPGLSLARGSVACCGRALLRGGFGSTPGLAGLPPPAVHSGVSAAGSRRCGGSGMFQPKGCGGGTEHVLAHDSNPLTSFWSLAPAAAPCLSPPRPGILRWLGQDGSRCGKSCCQSPCWSTAPSMTAELVNILHHR